MRSRQLVGLTLGLAVLTLLVPPAVRGQNSEKVEFDTVDRVKLRGSFYTSPKGRKAPVVMCLHKMGGSSSQDGWDKLALDLQKEGFAVLLFDFRGHGDSTGVEPAFWVENPENAALVRGFNRSNPQQSEKAISFKDFNQAYIPHLVNDVTAAKTYLDNRSDNGDCNSRNLIVIGAEEGATLGMLWSFSDMLRFRCTLNMFGQIIAKEATPEGNQLQAAIWLSPAPRLGNRSIPIRNWVAYVGQEKGVPMAFVYGAKNTADASVSKTLLAVAKDKKNNWTGEKIVKDTDLRGAGLLSDKLDTREWIVKDYLLKQLADKPVPLTKAHEIPKNCYVWDFPGGGLSKMYDEALLRRVPVEALLK